jgi:hypothetical protein
MNTKGTPIAFPLRAWLAVEVLFGIGAVLAVGLAPAETETNFAWPINPVVMAAVLGAFYMTSAPLFLLPLFAKRWEMIRVMILPTALFSTIQLAATFLHWDKFTAARLFMYGSQAIFCRRRSSLPRISGINARQRKALQLQKIKFLPG